MMSDCADADIGDQSRYDNLATETIPYDEWHDAVQTDGGVITLSVVPFDEPERPSESERGDTDA